MKYRFMNQPLETGLYEPEGIYLSTPFDGTHEVIQFFGQHPDHYAQYRYNSIASGYQASTSPCRRDESARRGQWSHHGD